MSWDTQRDGWMSESWREALCGLGLKAQGVQMLLLVGAHLGRYRLWSILPQARGFWGDSLWGRGTFSALSISNHVLLGVGERLLCVLRCLFPVFFFSWIRGERDQF